MAQKNENANWKPATPPRPKPVFTMHIKPVTPATWELKICRDGVRRWYRDGVEYNMPQLEVGG